MNTQFYNHLVQNPTIIDGEITSQLQEIVEKYPYFQSARALYLKGLNQQRSFLYNNALKKTAAYTTDRDILFDFIVSEDFITYKPLNIESIEIDEEGLEEVKKVEFTLNENIERTVLDTLVYIEKSSKETELIQKIDELADKKAESKQEQSIQQIKEDLEIGQPLQFDKEERHSFDQWLQLTQKKKETSTKVETPKEFSTEDKKVEIDKKTENTEESSNSFFNKLEIINKFIKNNPKIVPAPKNTPVTPVFIDNSEENEPSFMTETLAKIYLEQGKYTKAIQAYEILILKYPEKSSLFAKKIEKIKELQQYNNQ
ncbi:tetratricopeptide repeat protein [Capnocytophaga sp. ARDL2]|uniref:tetratricopeptide repeat protein n=1 Tax=Capnocytophaga sp. ARDL2 TaxID=3238809 RepID=UPI003557230E